VIQSADPIIVKIVEPKPTGWAEVLIGALGLTGAIILLAVLVGLGFAGVLFWLRSRSV
jgi:hypothetical protein